jgi:outer membrane protein OmpA-like peptidoglycan-associated protein
MKVLSIARAASVLLLVGCASRATPPAVSQQTRAADYPGDDAQTASRMRETEQKRRQLADAENRLEDFDDKADREARPPSERRAKAAFDRLLPFAAVKEEPRGMVVILPASVLFEGIGAELMETARARLDRVADALGEVKSHRIVVRGHEAKSDDARRDLELSQRRAEAVRAYLASRGVSAGRMRAEGRGRGEPVASNATSAGRAENQRVEIVVEGAGAAAQP